MENNSNLAATCTKNTMKSDKKVGLIRQPAAGQWEVIGQEQGMQNAQEDAAALGVISLHLELQSHPCCQDPSVPIAPPSTTSDMDLGKEEQFLEGSEGRLGAAVDSQSLATVSGQGLVGT